MGANKNYSDVIGFDFRTIDEVSEYESGIKFNVLSDLMYGPNTIPRSGLLSGLFCDLADLSLVIQESGYTNGLTVVIATQNFSHFVKKIWHARDMAGSDMTELEYGSHLKCIPALVDEKWKFIGMDIVDGWLNQIGWQLIPGLDGLLGVSERKWGLLPNEQVALRVLHVAEQFYANRTPLVVCAIYEVGE